MFAQPPSNRRAPQAAARATRLALARSILLHLAVIAAFWPAGRHVVAPGVALLPVAVVMAAPADLAEALGTAPAQLADQPAPPQPPDPAIEPSPRPAPPPRPATKYRAERRPAARPHAAASVAAVDPGMSAPPKGAFAAPPQGAFAAPPKGAFAAPPQGAFAAPPQGAFAAPPQATSAAPDIGPDWRLALNAWLQGRHRYPEAARSRGDEGRVTVRFTVDRAGRVLDAALAHSSGSAILDAAALAMLTDAVVPAFPPDMMQDRITVRVQIRYALHD